jgi:hypothetical protein
MKSNALIKYWETGTKKKKKKKAPNHQYNISFFFSVGGVQNFTAPLTNPKK